MENNQNTHKATRAQTLEVKYPGVPKEKIAMFISTLDQNSQYVFYKRFGKNLDEFNSGLTQKENSVMVKVYDKLRNYLANEEEFENIFEKRGINKQKLKDNMFILTLSTREIIIKVYGKNLDEYNTDEIIDFRRLSEAIKEISGEIILIDEKSIKYKKIVNYFDKYPAEYVYKAINKLDKETLKEIDKFEKSNLNVTEGLHLTIINRILKNLNSMYINHKHDIYRELGKSESYINTLIEEILTEKEKQLIKKTINNDGISKKEYKEFRNIVTKLKIKINANKQNEIIYNLCSDYSKEEVDNIIQNLTDYDKNELRLRYGDDFEHPVRSEEYTKENFEYFTRVLLPKIQGLLKDKNYVDVRKVKATVKIDPKLFKKKENNIKPEEKRIEPKTLLELFSEVSVDDLKILVSIIPLKYRQVLYKKHGLNLDEYNYFSHEEMKKYKGIYDEAITLLDKAVSIYNNKIICMCTTDIEIFTRNINNLKLEDLDILKKVHGQNLDKTLPLCVLDSSQRKKYTRIIDNLNSKKEQIIIEDNSLKLELLDKYHNTFSKSLSELDITYLIDLAISKFDNKNDIERFILNSLYDYLNNLVSNNTEIIEYIYKSKR